MLLEIGKIEKGRRFGPPFHFSAAGGGGGGGGGEEEEEE
jgi:hypothetical protein